MVASARTGTTTKKYAIIEYLPRNRGNIKINKTVVMLTKGMNKDQNGKPNCTERKMVTAPMSSNSTQFKKDAKAGKPATTGSNILITFLNRKYLVVRFNAFNKS